MRACGSAPRRAMGRAIPSWLAAEGGARGRLLERAGRENPMAGPTIRLLVSRYQPGVDAAPRFQVYTVPYRDDWLVLDALQYIKDTLDGTLALRWSCHMGI